jgi:hypothetical protein
MFAPIPWKARFKDFKFYNEKYFSGSIEPNPENLKDIQIKLHIRKKELINKTDRLLLFTFTMKLLPNCGEFAYDGECVIESPDQKTIGLLLDDSDSFRIRVEYKIYERAYPLVEKIAKEEGIFIPPSDIVLKVMQDDNKERIEGFDKIAEGFNKKNKIQLFYGNRNTNNKI